MNEERRKASACLQPGTNTESWKHGHEQPLELQQQQQMWHKQNPSWSCNAGGSMGPVTKLQKHYPSAAHPGGRWRPGHRWFLEVWDKASSSTLYSSLLELIWLAFLPWAIAEKTALSRHALTISRAADSHDSFFNYPKLGIFGCVTHGL